MVNTKLIDNFYLRNIKVEYFESLQEVKKAILSLVPIDCTVGIGHSVNIKEMSISIFIVNENIGF